MKKIVFLLLMAFVTKASAQSNDYLVSQDGIGALKIGMSIAELEKLLGKKVPLKYILEKDGSYVDTMKTRYKNMDVQLYLERRDIDTVDYDVVLMGVRTSSPLCKTKSGIGIGADKMKIITVYETNMIDVWPDFVDDTYTQRSKTRSVINVYYDDSENMITFYLSNKKVVSIEVMLSYGD